MSTKWLPGRVISGFTFEEEDFARANLKLAVVKRNFNFIEFYEDLSKDPYTIIPELRLPDESRYDFLTRLGRLYASGKPFFGGYADDFGFFERFIAYAQEYWCVATSEILKLLYPGKDLDDRHPLIAKGLPLLFYSPGVEEYGVAPGMDVYEGKQGYRHYKPKISGDVERFEKILKIDLRKPPGQLMQEFKSILEYEKEYLTVGKRLEPIMEQVLAEEYGLEQIRSTSRLFDWNIDDSRQRQEAWEQLKIWDLRRKVRLRNGAISSRNTFSRISDMLRMTEDLVKKRFYRAYELTQGREYNIEKNRELWIIYRSELKNECGTCEIREMCTDPCPDILPYIDQDRVGLSYSVPLPPEFFNMFNFEEEIRLNKKEGKWIQYYQNIPLKDINEPLPPESDFDEDEDEEAMELDG